MIVLTVVTASRSVRVGLRPPSKGGSAAQGASQPIPRTELPRFSSGSSKDRSGME